MGSTILQRELLQKLQRLRQGKNSVEEYYQELQTGMIRCGIVEENEAMLARFMGGLNREIQMILEYKEYTNFTRLFHLACKAEREVQDRQALARTNFSAGRPSSWTPRASSTSTRSATPAPPSAATSNRDTIKQAQSPLSAKSTPSGPAKSSFLHPWHQQGKHMILFVDVARVEVIMRENAHLSV